MSVAAARDLPFTIELWDESGTRTETVLAIAAHHIVGRGAFHAAERLYRGRTVTLRQGERLVATTQGRRGARLAAMNAAERA